VHERHGTLQLRYVFSDIREELLVPILVCAGRCVPYMSIGVHGVAASNMIIRLRSSEEEGRRT
jgi:hypothetical protein